MKHLISFGLLLPLMACGGKSGGNDNPTTAPVNTADTGLVTNPGVATSDKDETPPPAENKGEVKEEEKEDSASETPGTPLVPVATEGSLTLPFSAKVFGESIKCFDKSEESIALGQVFTDFRMFVSNITLINDKGEEIKLALDVAENSKNLQFIDNKNQGMALLNFIEASCASSDETATLKDTIVGTLPFGQYTAIKFQVGLPYAPRDEVALTKIPGALAPTDMAWMWEHFPVDFQIETHDGRSKKVLNSLMTANKKTITLPVSYLHAADAKAPRVDLELSKLFLTDAAAFTKGLEIACNQSPSLINETKSPHCAHAHKAFGFDVLNAKSAYSQTVFSIAP